MKSGPRWDIFCSVVDNFGDIGICWRLARQLAGERLRPVRLWCDDLVPLARIRPGADPGAAAQWLDGVEVRRWRPDFPAVSEAEAADVIVEAFGCQLPHPYVEAMAARNHPPVWVNLEYLSAEDWVAGCHRMSSPHPRLPLVKHFFFPGFSAGTGGLLRERDLLTERDAFQADADAQSRFWGDLGLPPRDHDELRLTLFAYENAAIPGLLATWRDGPRPVRCLVPEGRPLAQVSAFFGAATAAPGDKWQAGRLRVDVLPFVDQRRYDRLLWACDGNFVRGEDSFVRAQWAARPLFWHIYPQDDGAHWTKLESFLERYLANLATEPAEALRRFWSAWNRGEGAGEFWPAVAAHWPALTGHAGRWATDLGHHADLADQLAEFCESRL